MSIFEQSFDYIYHKFDPEVLEEEILKLNWCSGSWEDFSVNIFLLFHNYFPLEKGVALHLFKLESPPIKNAFAKFG